MLLKIFDSHFYKFEDLNIAQRLLCYISSQLPIVVSHQVPVKYLSWENKTQTNELCLIFLNNSHLYFLFSPLTLKY